jgi:predicted flap endonuclease-1-like 5' DNA nuclease
MTKLTEVEGIGEVYTGKLAQAGIGTAEALLERGASRKGRKELAAQAGIDETLILKWVNRVDLSRVSGIGEQYAGLLEAAGVDTVPELAQRRADNLYQKLVEVNQAKKLVRQLPSEGQVRTWVEAAAALPRVVEH